VFNVRGLKILAGKGGGGRKEGEREKNLKYAIFYVLHSIHYNYVIHLALSEIISGVQIPVGIIDFFFFKSP
jgi:hypothetical protein